MAIISFANANTSSTMNKITLQITTETVWLIAILLGLAVSTPNLQAQGALSHEPGKTSPIKMTSFAFGGTGALVSKVNDQMNIMEPDRIFPISTTGICVDYQFT